MDPEEYRIQGKKMVDFVADYMINIRKYDVLPSVTPGYLQQLLPSSAPENPVTFENVMKDVENTIMPGMTHWLHPHFHAFYPTAFSYPSMLGSMLSDCFATIGLNWQAGPACTELEILVIDWLAKAMELPEKFLSTSASGGGSILGSASEATLMAILVARNSLIKEIQTKNKDLNDGEITDKMRVYHTAQAHSSVERACKISLLKNRYIATNEDESMDAEDLRRLIKEDQENNLYPLLVISSCGSTSMCSFDNLEEIGQTCISLGVKCYVDAAYAGGSMICPEYRHLTKGVEYINSLCFNAHKTLKTQFDFCILWTDDRHSALNAFRNCPAYLSHDFEEVSTELRHLQIPLGRKFRALKLWFVLNMFGIRNLQESIRLHVKLAKIFSEKIKESAIFEVINKVDYGLVCFRLKDGNEKTRQLFEAMKCDHSIFLSASFLEKKDIFFIRFVCGAFCTENDVIVTFDKINSIAAGI